MTIPPSRKHFNEFPTDFQSFIARPYCFNRMQDLVNWYETNCIYWSGVEDQIGKYQRNIKTYGINWLVNKHVYQFTVTEMQMLQIYKRDLAIRNILE